MPKVDEQDKDILVVSVPGAVPIRRVDDGWCRAEVRVKEPRKGLEFRVWGLAEVWVKEPRKGLGFRVWGLAEVWVKEPRKGLGFRV